MAKSAETFVGISVFIATAYRSDIWRPLLVRMFAEPPKLEAALFILRRFPDQQPILVDAFGLYVMQIRGVRMCWSTDSHLELMGVPPTIHTREGSLLDRFCRDSVNVD